MKKYIYILRIMFFLLISSSVFAQEDAYKEYQKQKKNNGELEEFKQNDSTVRIYISYIEKKNEFSYSLGTMYTYSINQFMFNYRRSLFIDSKLDVGVNMTLGCNYTIDLFSYQLDTDPATFLASASVSIAYGVYNGIEFNFGEVYFEEYKSVLSSNGGHFQPYFSALYVKKFKQQPLVFKVGLSYPYFTYLSIGVKF